MEQTDVAIVGGGPIGLEMAAALERSGIEYVVIEAGQIGSTIEWYAPGTFFFSSPDRIAIAGVPLVTLLQTKATREEYLMYLRGVVEQFQLRIRRYTRVVSIERRDGAFTLGLRRSHHGVGGPHEADIATRATKASTE